MDSGVDATLSDGGGDGASDASTSEPSEWVTTFAMLGNRQAVASDTNGNVIISGATGTATGMLFAKFDRSGHLLWNKTFAGSFDGSGVAVDSSNDIVLTGVGQTSSFSVGGPTLGIASFVAKFRPDGSLIWSQQVVAGSSDDAPRVVLDSANNVIVIGRFTGGVPVAGGPTLSGSYSVYVAKLGPDGTFTWSQSFGSNSDVRAAAPDRNGGAVFAGSGAVCGASASSYVAHITGAGACTNAVSIGDYMYPLGVAVDGAGNAFVSMQTDPQASTCPGDFATTLTKYDPSLGIAWVKCLSGGIYPGQEGTGVLADDAGNVTIVGSLNAAPDASIDLGGGPLSVVGPFAAQFSATGAYVAARVWPMSGYVLPVEVAPGPASDLFLLGLFNGSSLDFGQGPGADAGGTGFLAREAF